MGSIPPAPVRLFKELGRLADHALAALDHQVVHDRLILQPILQVLRGAGLSDVVAVVVRWYGGTKLGKGGLARAYAGATRDALPLLPVALRVPTERLALRVPYEKVGAVKRLVHPPEVELEGEEYGAEARLVLAVHEGRVAALRDALADLGIDCSSKEVFS